MILFKCDACGYEVFYKGIVKHHMSFMKNPAKESKHRRFEQLIPQLETDEVTDVCEDCFKNIEDKRREVARAQEDQNNGIFSKVREYIGGLRG